MDSPSLDPALSLTALKLVVAREDLLAALEDICDTLRRRRGNREAEAAPDPAPAVAECFRVMSALRSASAAVVAAIIAWRESGETRAAGALPPPFLWKGDNYLLKMANDCNFLAGVPPLVAALGVHPATLCRNPMMLPNTLDDNEDAAEAAPAVAGPHDEERAVLRRVAATIREEERWEAERDRRKATAAATTSAGCERQAATAAEVASDAVAAASAAFLALERPQALPALAEGPVAAGAVVEFDAPPPLPGSDVQQMAARSLSLSGWYEEARRQLIALSVNNTDAEYYVRSRRFNRGAGAQAAAAGPMLPHYGAEDKAGAASLHAARRGRRRKRPGAAAATLSEAGGIGSEKSTPARASSRTNAMHTTYSPPTGSDLESWADWEKLASGGGGGSGGVGRGGRGGGAAANATAGLLGSRSDSAIASGRAVADGRDELPTRPLSPWIGAASPVGRQALDSPPLPPPRGLLLFKGLRVLSDGRSYILTVLETREGSGGSGGSSCGGGGHSDGAAAAAAGGVPAAQREGKKKQAVGGAGLFVTAFDPAKRSAMTLHICAKKAARLRSAVPRMGGGDGNSNVAWVLQHLVPKLQVKPAKPPKDEKSGGAAKPAVDDPYFAGTRLCLKQQRRFKPTMPQGPAAAYVPLRRGDPVETAPPSHQGKASAGPQRKAPGAAGEARAPLSAAPSASLMRPTAAAAAASARPQEQRGGNSASGGGTSAGKGAAAAAAGAGAAAKSDQAAEREAPAPSRAAQLAADKRRSSSGISSITNTAGKSSESLRPGALALRSSSNASAGKLLPATRQPSLPRGSTSSQRSRSAVAAPSRSESTSSIARSNQASLLTGKGEALPLGEGDGKAAPARRGSSVSAGLPARRRSNQDDSEGSDGSGGSGPALGKPAASEAADADAEESYEDDAEPEEPGASESVLGEEVAEGLHVAAGEAPAAASSALTDRRSSTTSASAAAAAAADAGLEDDEYPEDFGGEEEGKPSKEHPAAAEETAAVAGAADTAAAVGGAAAAAADAATAGHTEAAAAEYAEDFGEDVAVAPPAAAAAPLAGQASGPGPDSGYEDEFGEEGQPAAATATAAVAGADAASAAAEAAPTGSSEAGAQPESSRGSAAEKEPVKARQSSGATQYSEGTFAMEEDDGGSLANADAVAAPVERKSSSIRSEGDPGSIAASSTGAPKSLGGSAEVDGEFAAHFEDDYDAQSEEAADPGLSATLNAAGILVAAAVAAAAGADEATDEAEYGDSEFVAAKEYPEAPSAQADKRLARPASPGTEAGYSDDDFE